MYHFKIAFRNIFKQKLNNAIIVISLAIGIACISLIAVYLSKELKTDNFISDKENIYALTCDHSWKVGEKLYNWYLGAPLYIKENFPQVDELCYYKNEYPSKIEVNNEIVDNDYQIINASNNFFSFFGYELIQGNPELVLKSNNAIVISEELALKYFGTTDALNKVITIETYQGVKDMLVSGIFKQPSENSHLRLDMVQLFNEKHIQALQGYSYIRINNKSSAQELQASIDANTDDLPKSGGLAVNYYLKPLKEIYFDPDFRGHRDRKDLWIAFFIGILILVIASFNYLGITNSKLTARIKDYKIQRINGSTHIRFIMNFLFENLILIFVALLISEILILESLPFFNQITNSQITVNYIFDIHQFIWQVLLIGFLVLITFLFVIQRISVNITTTSLNSKSKNPVKQFKIPAFSIFQLASTVLLIISSFVVLKQINFISNKPVGFDKDVYAVNIPTERMNKIPVFKVELLKNALVENVSIGSDPMNVGLSRVSYERDGEIIDFVPAVVHADHDFIKTTSIKVVEGNDVSDGALAENQCLVNESFLKLFPGENLIGKKLPVITDFSMFRNKTIVGVTEDFHHSSLKSWIDPVIIFNEERVEFNRLLVKTNNKNISESINMINQVWNNLDTEYKIEITTLGDEYEKLHRENKSFIKLISSCCFISIFLSIIGLFAISVQDAQKRTKEIGIRKVNGAKIVEILALLNKDFAMWSLTAIIIAKPIAYYLMNKWLQSFAYKTELSWWVFALSGLLALGIALLTVSFQSWRAATRNPVEALRYE